MKPNYTIRSVDWEAGPRTTLRGQAFPVCELAYIPKLDFWPIPSLSTGNHPNIPSNSFRPSAISASSLANLAMISCGDSCSTSSYSTSL